LGHGGEPISFKTVTEAEQQQATRPPSVDALARSLAEHSTLPHSLLVQCARRAIDVTRNDHSANVGVVALSYAQDTEAILMRDAVNASGVLLHTNLGRAPLAVSATDRAVTVEFDLRTGKRGSRHFAVSELLQTLIGCEAAVVVNNNAAAVLLVLAALAHEQDVVVSRGESVEIGGGFRIPDVMEQSGARLVDVGTTNKTKLRDYEKACANKKNNVALVMKIHPSNFAMRGFVEDTSVEELASLSVPIVVDIGSGLLDNNVPWVPSEARSLVGWVEGEPAAKQCLKDGASLVLFSGDKLLGGPQCGIIAGSRELVDACASHPLMRALRPGSHTLLGLQSVLLSYLSGTVTQDVPFWAMTTASIDTLQMRAHDIVSKLPSAQASVIRVVETEALPGAGSAPGSSIPSVAISITGDHSVSLRRHDTPVIARIDGAETIIDLRSCSAGDDGIITQAIANISL
jgi:L-seryl-tRNA(Ser) seleniumtransferase